MGDVLRRPRVEPLLLLQQQIKLKESIKVDFRIIRASNYEFLLGLGSMVMELKFVKSVEIWKAKIEYKKTLGHLVLFTSIINHVKNHKSSFLKNKE